MAPSNKRTLLIALLVAAFAVVVQPSAAAINRAEVALAAASSAAAAASGREGSGLPPLPPQPKECRPWLMKMVPCFGFLSNHSVYSPEAACCPGFNAMLLTLDTATCICHVVNGDISELMPAPMLHMRMVELFRLCGRDNVPVRMVEQSCSQLEVPPIDLPSPPPSMPSPSPSPEPEPESEPSSMLSGYINWLANLLGNRHD